MKKRFSTTHLWLTLCTLLMATSFSFAQSQPQPTTIPNMYLVRVTRVKPEMVREYREFIQNESIPAYKKGGVKLQNTMATPFFGEAFEFITIEPAESLKQFDGPGPINKALGAEGAQAYQAKWRRLIAGAHGYIVQLRPDLSVNLPKPGAPPAKGAMAVWITVAPGRQAEYESYVKSDVMPILQKAYPKGVLTSKVLLGGNGNEYRVLALVDSFAELESGMLTATREGWAKIQPKTAGIVLHSETSVLRYVPELSIGPEARTAEKK